MHNWFLLLFFCMSVCLSVCPLSCASLYEISISNCLCDGMLVMCQCVCMFLWWCEKLVDNMERKHKYICILLKGIVKLCIFVLQCNEFNLFIFLLLYNSELFLKISSILDLLKRPACAGLVWQSSSVNEQLICISVFWLFWLYGQLTLSACNTV